MVLTFLLLVATSVQAHAEDTVNPAVFLKTDIYISDKVVTVGDIFENAGAHANHVLAPAPQADETMILGMSDLVRIKDAFELNWTPLNKFDKAVLQRAVSEIDKSDIARLVEQSILKDFKGKEVELEISTVLPRMVFQGRKDPLLHVTNQTWNPVDNSFNVSVKATGEHGTTKDIDVEGFVYQLTNIPVLDQNIRNGIIIREHNVKMLKLRQNSLNENVALSMNDLIGMTPRRMVQSDRPVRLADLEKPQIVEKGEIITLTLNEGPLSLTAKGRALDAGAKGDVIRVMNLSSKRTIEGLVSAPQRVEIAKNLTP